MVLVCCIFMTFVKEAVFACVCLSVCLSICRRDKDNSTNCCNLTIFHVTSVGFPQVVFMTVPLF